MPSNVGYEYAKAQEKYEKASSDEEKLSALMEMRSTAPSHKGAEKLRAEITKKIASLRRRMEKQKEQQKKTAAKSMHMKKEGCAQAVLAGMPNSGKSRLLNALTSADTRESAYPFTTRKPVQGMMDFRGAKVQLVELPAIIEGSASGKARGLQVLSIVRNADAIVLVLNADLPEYEMGVLLKELEKARIIVSRKRPEVEIKKSGFPGLNISGKHFLKVPEKELEKFLKDFGLGNADVILKEPAGLKEIAEILDSRIKFKKALAVVNKSEKKGEGKLKGMECFYFDGKNAEELKGKVFELLGLVLVYTKKPGKDADLKAPLVLRKGSTIGDVARQLHKDFAKKLRYAKLWGSAKFQGQMVSRNYELKNGDVIEIYA